MKNINDILDDTVEAEIVTDEVTDLNTEIVTRLEKYQTATKKAVQKKDVEALRAIHKSLHGKVRTSNQTHNWTDKVKYTFWGVGFIFGAIIGFIVGGITTVFIANVDALNGVVGWIQLLIVLLFGGLGLFIADLQYDKRRQ